MKALTLAALTALALPAFAQTEIPADTNSVKTIDASPAKGGAAASDAQKNSIASPTGPADSGIKSESLWSRYGPYNVYLGVGTTGAAIGTGFAGAPWYNLRAEYNTASLNRTEPVDDITYNIDFKLQNQALYLDLRPFKGTFRFTVGLSSQQSRLGLEGTKAASNGSPSESASARVELPSSMPYAGFGWGLGKNTSGFGMFFDVGAFFGTPKITQFSLRVNGQTDAAEEERRRRELQDDLDKLKVYPVIKTGLTYHF